jgi:ketosteroid isomerase-like protein
MKSAVILSLSVLLGPLPALAAPADGCDGMKTLEAGRNAAIRDHDLAALKRIYAPDFRGITSAGAFVDRDSILKLFVSRDSSGSAVTSEILSCRALGDVLEVTGRLTIRAKDSGELVSDGYYLHLFRHADGRWQLTGGMSTPAAKG